MESDNIFYIETKINKLIKETEDLKNRINEFNLSVSTEHNALFDIINIMDTQLSHYRKLMRANFWQRLKFAFTRRI